MRRVLACVLTLLTLFVSMGAPTALAADSKQAPVDRIIKDGRISESSGLALSLLHPGILWTHNDSGHPPRIYAINKDGTTAATITIAGQEDRDWESITSFRWPPGTGQAYIAIGDIGDNNFAHAESRIIIIPEPKTLTTQTISPQRVIRFGYPKGPRDAETLLSDPRSGRFLIVTKDLFSSSIFAIRANVWPDTKTGVSGLATAQPVAGSSASLITDGTFLPDGRMLLRGYGEMFLLPRPDQVANGRLKVLDRIDLPDQEQGESLTVEDGGRYALIGSEGDRQPVLRLDLQALGMLGAGQSGAGAGAGSPAEASPNPSDSSGVTSAPSGSSGIGISGNTILAGAVGLVALALIALGIAVLVIRRG